MKPCMKPVEDRVTGLFACRRGEGGQSVRCARLQAASLAVTRDVLLVSGGRLREKFSGRNGAVSHDQRALESVSP